MTTPAPPWCLHWGNDGELGWSDRHDVIERLVAHEPAMASALCSHAKPLPASISRQRLMRTRSCSHP
jgi:hypothetical protein